MTYINDTKRIRDQHGVGKIHLHVGTIFDCWLCTLEYLCTELEKERSKNVL